MNKVLLVNAIRDKMKSIMATEEKQFTDTYFANEIGISKATLSRILNFKDIELSNAITVCKWLNQPIDNFITK